MREWKEKDNRLCSQRMRPFSLQPLPAPPRPHKQTAHPAHTQERLLDELVALASDAQAAHAGGDADKAGEAVR